MTLENTIFQNLISATRATNPPVGVAQRDAEVPGDGLQGVDRDVNQSGDDDEDVDGRPADDEDCHHHQDHAGDPAQIPVLFLLVRGGNKRGRKADDRGNVKAEETERKQNISRR